MDVNVKQFVVFLSKVIFSKPGFFFSSDSLTPAGLVKNICFICLF